ncbi:hypothetical protein G3545_15215 [Starkeya sp. ORNL1]|uniref:hypothetical protein n=1 Tax=Starkeya sp. ORNL1 TaxID=2709380 RepID=UPI0014634929|nr:hypothetical protein [Starkeya sp. ORNL1]QJP14877.1 hypothetical protein G3545_15215 [Starkeya sp. ORNL1]
MIRLLAVPVLFLATLVPAGAADHESAYTTHDWEKCPADESPEPDIVTVHKCPGLGGFDVVWTGEEDGSWVGFGTAPLKEEYGFASFFEAGERVEWRGPNAGAPVAAILRYRVGSRIGKLSRTLLVVYRLEPGGKSCIMGEVAGGADANAKARRLVDQRAAGFACGTSKRLSQ